MDPIGFEPITWCLQSTRSKPLELRAQIIREYCKSVFLYKVLYPWAKSAIVLLLLYAVPIDGLEPPTPSLWWISKYLFTLLLIKFLQLSGPLCQFVSSEAGECVSSLITLANYLIACADLGNYDIPTPNLTGWRSASELQVQIPYRSPMINDLWVLVDGTVMRPTSILVPTTEFESAYSPWKGDVLGL